MAFIQAIDAVEKARRKGKGDEKFGFDIISQALEAPTFNIAANSGVDGDLVVSKVREATGNIGLNAATQVSTRTW